MPLDSTPRSFAFLISEHRPRASFAPTSAHGTFCPAATLGAPHTIVQRLAGARVDLGHAQLVGVGMRRHALHVADDDAGELGRDRRDLLDLEPAHRERVRELARPACRRSSTSSVSHCSGDSHRNCARNFRSFSKKSRRSFTPYLSIARRSSPMPKAKPEYFSGSMPHVAQHVGMHARPAPAISR